MIFVEFLAKEMMLIGPHVLVLVRICLNIE